MKVGIFDEKKIPSSRAMLVKIFSYKCVHVHVFKLSFLFNVVWGTRQTPAPANEDPRYTFIETHYNCFNPPLCAFVIDIIDWSYVLYQRKEDYTFKIVFEQSVRNEARIQVFWLNIKAAFVTNKKTKWYEDVMILPVRLLILFQHWQKLKHS